MNAAHLPGHRPLRSVPRSCRPGPHGYIAPRRRRDTLFGDDAELFGEAAWDILLDLYAAQKANRPVCVSSASIASVAPTSTGLRYIASMERRGLIARTPDPHDRRRNWLHLTERALTLMEAYLANPEV